MEGFARQQAVHLFGVGDAAYLKALLGQITLKERPQAHIVIHNQDFVILLHYLSPKGETPVKDIVQKQVDH
ncbi:hypothetical protein [Candidatus Sodalis endolongispinus]|uniref:hypothetical protein n=1 Tax=Candidatus Sodalis endolongispinus TaxID=2812662 RepID=UPI0035E40F3B